MCTNNVILFVGKALGIGVVGALGGLAVLLQ